MADMRQLLLREFYQLADWTRETADYFKGQNLDDQLVLAHAGTAAVLRCSFDGSGYFDFAPEGEPSLVFEVLDEDAATTIDLCAFAVAHAGRFGTAMGIAPVLGLTNISNPASWAFGKMLSVHRTPLEWLRDGCQGTVILDHMNAPAALGKALGPLLATDEGHARQLREMLCTPPVDPRNIIFKNTARRAA